MAINQLNVPTQPPGLFNATADLPLSDGRTFCAPFYGHFADSNDCKNAILKLPAGPTPIPYINDGRFGPGHLPEVHRSGMYGLPPLPCPLNMGQRKKSRHFLKRRNNNNFTRQLHDPNRTGRAREPGQLPRRAGSNPQIGLQGRQLLRRGRPHGRIHHVDAGTDGRMAHLGGRHFRCSFPYVFILSRAFPPLFNIIASPKTPPYQVLQTNQKAILATRTQQPPQPPSSPSPSPPSCPNTSPRATTTPPSPPSSPTPNSTPPPDWPRVRASRPRCGRAATGCSASRRSWIPVDTGSRGGLCRRRGWVRGLRRRRVRRKRECCSGLAGRPLVRGARGQRGVWVGSRRRQRVGVERRRRGRRGGGGEGGWGRRG